MLIEPNETHTEAQDLDGISINAYKGKIRFLLIKAVI